MTLSQHNDLPAAGHEYDADFFQWVEATARESARRILPLVRDIFHPNSVLDVGCGSGTWLETWNKLGVPDFNGVDGSYALKSPLQIDKEHFKIADLAAGFDCGRQFDLVQSLEVAEHIAPERAEAFVAALAAHGDIILFSAARPGQGGEFHVNEQHPAYWRKLFAKHGYRMFDPIRPQFVNDNAIAPWYRYNLFVFVRGPALEKFRNFLEPHDVTEKIIPDVAPALWRLRCGILSLLPEAAVNLLSRLRYQIMNFIRRFA